MRICNSSAWERYRRLLPDSRTLGLPRIPSTLPSEDVRTDFDYVPPEDFMNALRDWLSSRDENTIYYFLTEVASGDTSDYELRIDEVNHETVAGLNPGAENVFVGKKFDWAVFIDHMGVVHAAGPPELRDLVKRFARRSNRESTE